MATEPNLIPGWNLQGTVPTLASGEHKWHCLVGSRYQSGFGTRVWPGVPGALMDACLAALRAIQSVPVNRKPLDLALIVTTGRPVG
jgi:hypothetical protein